MGVACCDVTVSQNAPRHPCRVRAWTDPNMAAGVHTCTITVAGQLAREAGLRRLHLLWFWSTFIPSSTAPEPSRLYTPTVTM
ncbi:hypothetical protein EYF80_039652 [Liparis tanakae]|uniref:Uncharacterized protein n=1 Tax=Liparis tanakae TaxID=230148 RepID=A0A4Z2GB68_9TELE|nr:hypothetical protein EYF80_039652 [Liparis tanakae]